MAADTAVASLWLRFIALQAVAAACAVASENADRSLDAKDDAADRNSSAGAAIAHWAPSAAVPGSKIICEQKEGGVDHDRGTAPAAAPWGFGVAPVRQLDRSLNDDASGGLEHETGRIDFAFCGAHHDSTFYNNVSAGFDRGIVLRLDDQNIVDLDHDSIRDRIG